MDKVFERFASEEVGSVTLDWFILCAGVLGLAVALVSVAAGSDAPIAIETAAPVTVQVI
jgi:hypothetical protein